MKLRHALVSALLAVSIGAGGVAASVVVSVEGTAGPWDPAIAGNFSYGVGDQTAATFVAVNSGDNITITYVSGLTSAFGGVGPIVDANGHVGGIFGSGADCGGSPCTGIGSSGNPFPSAFIDPTNTGPQIALNALIGAFVNSSGVVLNAFATGNGPFSTTAPLSAVALLLGVNDDIFTFNGGALSVIDNTGALSIEVAGSTVAAAIPEPPGWATMLLALIVIGVSMRARRPAAS